MADDGLLSQADIDAALGIEAPSGATDGSATAEPTDAGMSGALSQEEIDAAIAGASTDVAEADGASMSQSDIDAALAEAGAAEAQATAAATAVAPPPAEAEAEAFGLPDFASEMAPSSESAAAIELLHDIDLDVRIELGRTRMYVADVLRLGSGSVVELDKLAGDPVDVFVNDRLVARGEVLVLNDTFCVRINEIIVPPSRLAPSEESAECA